MEQMEFDPQRMAGIASEAMKELPDERVGVVVVGSTGAGKSTLLNAMFGEKNLARTGIGSPQTRKAEWWPKAENDSHRIGKYPLRILDTKGMEEAEYQNTLDEMLAAVREANDSEDVGNHAHIAWLVIKESSARIQQSHKTIVERLTQDSTPHRNVPVIVVVTEAIDPEIGEEFEVAVRGALPGTADVVRINSVPKLSVPVHGLNDLSEATLKVLPEASRNAMIRATIVALDRKREIATKAVNVAASMAAITGATPIPFADAGPLLAIQTGMIAKVSHAYGIEIREDELIPVMAAIGSNMATTIAGRAIVSGILKLIPGAGQFVGGTISAVTAAALTKALGQLYVEFVDLLCRKNGGHPPSLGDVAAGFSDYYRKRGGDVKKELEALETPAGNRQPTQQVGDTESEEQHERRTKHQVTEFEERSFWDKIASAVGNAGREVLEMALTLYYTLIDEETPAWAKATIIGALIYFISPVDAVPDVLPGIGYTDDLAVMAAAAATVAAHIKREHRERAHDWVERNLGNTTT